jgi:phosphoglycerate dehydrogenase-like enzyme
MIRDSRGFVSKFDTLALFGFTEADLVAPLGAELERALRLRARAVVVASVAAELGDADALVLQLGTAADRSVLERASRLRYLGIFGTDQARVDVAFAASRGITVKNVPGYSTESVAEFAIAALLERLRALDEEKARARAGNLADGPGGAVLRNKTLGIVGLGRIGTRVAEIARRGFGSEVAYFSRTRRPELERSLGLFYRELLALAAESSVVFVHLPLTEATAGLLDRALLEKTPPGAIWIHLSPLELLDLDALDERLARGDFGFVFDHGDELEAATLTRLARHPGAVAYPPVACNTEAARAEKLRLFLSDVDAFLAEGPGGPDGPSTG